MLIELSAPKIAKAKKMEGQATCQFVRYYNARPALTSSSGTDSVLSWFSKVSGVFLGFLFVFFFLF